MKRSSPTSAASKYKALLDKVEGMDLTTGGFWKPKEGRSKIRVLPPVGNMEFFFCESGRHYKQNQYCPRLCSEGELECPICDLNETLFREGNKEAAASFRAGRSFWMNIIDRANEDSGPQLYTPGIKVFQMLVALISDSDYGDITDPEDGFDLKLDRTGTKRDDTDYMIIAMRNPSALGTEDQIDEWLKSAIDLSERVRGNLHPYDKLIQEAGLQAYFDDEEEEPLEEPDPRPIPSTRRRSTRRRRRQ